QICSYDSCGLPLVNYRDGRFCQGHATYERRCGIRECPHDALQDAPACDNHLALYRKFELHFGRDRSLFANRRQMRRMQAIQSGEQRMEWEPAPEPWDAAIHHYWQAKHVKVIEIAVTTCGVPISHTKFPFDEGENNIADFMGATWPAHNQHTTRPTYLAIDKGCKVMTTLNTRQELQGAHGWMATTNIKVDTWHYNGHGIDDLCTTWCNPNDQHDPNLIQLTPDTAPTHRANANAARGQGRRAQGRQTAVDGTRLQRAFNFEAAEHLNADLGKYSASMTKMKPENQDLFLCILLKEQADRIMASSVPVD
ncbi:hypothetical protein JAAARDRAFT_129478, partial [Jaapia argillacea MUCL 33604]